MRIQDMFERDIDRDINGVVKVAQEDEAAVEQELSEYVVTRELSRHFASFFDSYEHALDTPTDKVGVWISGFFGSGKSHFLKMLSYLLTNKVVAGKPAIEYFDGKFEDPMVDAKARRCASVPTESILFNVDNKAPSSKDADALKRTFARVFYDHLGFYGEDLKLARLERFVDDRGLTQEFRAAFERINGEPWVDARAEYDFFSDDLIDALEQAGVMSRAEAERWLEDPSGSDMSIEALTDQIRDYANAQAEAHGGNFRLLFMADEIGQYIGSDSNLMLNLQTIVEELGTKCAGRVWVMVTSQEAIDEVTKVVGQDFSKIQGRFNTRLSLSSSSADEVIKRRILEKNEPAADLLRAQYAETSSVLKNLFTFEKSTADLIGYADEGEFVQTFPFASYQFRLMQSVMSAIRNHGSTGKHLSSGERSMLSGFQETAQRVEGRDENALVPFWMFYDAVQTFFESYIRRVIERATDAAEKGQGLEPQDVNVLKLLLLLKWDKDLKTTLGNIVTLMTDDVRADRMALRESVQASLDRLVHENYVSRNGDTYQFLTDDEQDIARQISRQDPDPARVRAKVASLFFDQVFASGKLVMGENTFDIEKWVDETRVGQTGGLTLRIMTMLADEADLERTQLIMRSQRTPEAIVVLNEETNYYDPLREALQIEMFTKTQIVANLPQSQQDIIRSKNQQKVELEKRAAELIEEAVRRGTFFAAGEEIRPAASQNAKRLVEDVASRLVERVYHKLPLVQKNYQSDADIRAILNGSTRTLDTSMDLNTGAVDAVEKYLDAQGRLMHKPAMAEVQDTFQNEPYGWRQIDVAACMAELLAQGRAKATYAGKTLELSSSKLVDCLRKPKDGKACTIERRTHVSEGVRKLACEAVREFCNASNVPTAEDELAARATELLGQRVRELQDRLDKDYARGAHYPGRVAVEHAIKLAQGLLARGKDPADLLPAIKDAYDDLLDAAEDLEPVEEFWRGQRDLFDRAYGLAKGLADETGYLEANQEATRALEQIKQIVTTPAPYGRIKDLGGYRNTLEAAYDELLKAKRNELLDAVRDMYANINGYATEKGVSLPEAKSHEEERQSRVHESRSLTQLDALKAQLENDQKTFYRQVDDALARKIAAKPATTDVTLTGSASSPAGAIQPAIAAPAPAKPRVKTLARSLACPPKRLSTPDDVNAYVEALRAKLLNALKDNDAVQIN